MIVDLGMLYMCSGYRSWKRIDTDNLEACIAECQSETPNAGENHGCDGIEFNTETKLCQTYHGCAPTPQHNAPWHLYLNREPACGCKPCACNNYDEKTGLYSGCKSPSAPDFSFNSPSHQQSCYDDEYSKEIGETTAGFLALQVPSYASPNCPDGVDTDWGCAVGGCITCTCTSYSTATGLYGGCEQSDHAAGYAFAAGCCCALCGQA